MADGAYVQAVKHLSGLVGYWRLNEGSGSSAADSSGNGNTGTFTGTYSLAAAGPIAGDSTSKALNCEDSGYVTVPNSSTLSLSGNSFTLGCWVSLSTYSPREFQGLVTKWAYNGLGYGVLLNGATSATVPFASVTTSQNPSGSQNNTLTTNQTWSENPTWYFVVGVYDGSYIYTYLNGALVSGSQVASTGAIQSTSADPLYLGTSNNETVEYPLQGYLSECFVSSAALTASQIANLWALGIGTSLVASGGSVSSGSATAAQSAGPAGHDQSVSSGSATPGRAASAAGQSVSSGAVAPAPAIGGTGQSLSSGAAAGNMTAAGGAAHGGASSGGSVTATNIQNLIIQTTRYSVAGGQAYTGMGWSMPAGPGRYFTTGISWYGANGQALGSSIGGYTLEQTGSWSMSTCNAVAPYNATSASLFASWYGVQVGVLEQHYLAQAGLFPGTVTQWSPGGLIGSATTTVEFSDDNGTTWTPMRYGSGITLNAAEQAVIVDYEVIPGQLRLYRAVVDMMPTNALPGTVITSGYGQGAALAGTVSSYWLVDPLEPALSIPLNVTDNPTSVHEAQAQHYPLGSKYPTTVADTVSGLDGSLTVETMDMASWTAVRAAANSQRVKWLIRPYGDGRYVRLGGAPPTLGISGLVQQGTIAPSPASHPYQTLTIQYVEAARP